VQQADTGRRITLAAGFALALVAISLSVWRESYDPRLAVSLGPVRGLVHTSEADVIAAAALPPNRNAWLINRGAVARRIEALPWIGRASLRVIWPNSLAIEVTERQPVARVELSPTQGEEPQARYAVVDETQRILSLRVSAQEAQLPVLVVLPLPRSDATVGTALASKDIARALAALQALRALGLRVSEVAIAPSTGISATADRNLRVLFGDDEDLAKKAQLFEAIVAKISTPQRVAYVDVRSVRAPTVLYR
jgi:cell division protein FtsQ